VVAELAKKTGILTVGVVTKPFAFEGAKRREIAEKGLEGLRQHVDTIIVIPNDRILQIIDKKTSLLDAFRTVDDVLRQGVAGISDLITTPGMINVDFADVKAVMQNSGSALMGIGRGTGENRSIDAARAAIDSPLLEMAIDGAKGVLFNITGGKDLGMYEVEEAAKLITKSVDPDAKIIFGAVIDEDMDEEVKITVVATGFDDDRKRPEPMMKREEPVRLTSESIAGRQKPVAMPTPVIEEELEMPQDQDELEIPAFIRKKIK
jgi:cell division protein FtsZ